MNKHLVHFHAVLLPSDPSNMRKTAILEEEIMWKRVIIFHITSKISRTEKSLNLGLGLHHVYDTHVRFFKYPITELYFQHKNVYRFQSGEHYINVNKINVMSAIMFDDFWTEVGIFAEENKAVPGDFFDFALALHWVSVDVSFNPVSSR